MSQYPKRLYRSKKDRVLFGILGGLGKYFNVDPVIFRIAFVALLIMTGIVPFGLVYLVAYFIIPLEPGTDDAYPTTAKEE